VFIFIPDLKTVIMNKIRLLVLLLFTTTLTFSQQTNEDLMLLQAAYEGNESKLLEALINKANIDASTENGVTALVYAAQRGYTDIVKILVFNGANINHCTNDSVSPLLAAAMFNYLDIVKYLASKGANIYVTNNSGIGALHYAAAYGYDSLTTFLIENKANINSPDSEGNSPLMIACFTGNDNIARILISKGALLETKDKRLFTLLMASVQNGYFDLSKYLLEKGSNILAANDEGGSALTLAIMQKQYSLISLLGTFVKDNKSSINPYLVAYENKDYKAVRLLKSSGIENYNKIIFSDYSTCVGINLNPQHVMLDIKAGLHEIVSGFDFFANYQVRLFRKKVLVETSPGLQNQYFESRSFVGLGMNRDFNISENHKTPEIFVNAGIYYTFGNYRATLLKPDANLIIIPAFGLKYNIDQQSSVRFALNYISYDIKNLFPLHLSFNLQTYFDLKNPKLMKASKLTIKKISWLY